MKRAFICLVIGLAFVSCGHPKPQPDSDPYESTVLVPMTYFPLDTSASKNEMEALTVKVLDIDSSGRGVVQLPSWMTGSWAIRGSSEFQKAVISDGKIKFESSRREKLKTGVPFFDSEFLVLGAAVSPSGRLFAIHEGIPKAFDADSLYAGYLEITKRDNGSRKTLEWNFTERNIGYGYGLVQSDREHWTFTRTDP